jgi:hypothetical protein
VRLRVISADEEAARLLRSPLTAAQGWSLHARFERAVILASGVDGALLSLVRHDLADGPFTARLGPEAPRDLRSLDGVPDVDERGAVTWRPALIDATDAAEPDEVERRLRQLGDIARRSGAGVRGIHAVARDGDLGALSRALSSGDPEAAAAVAQQLAGLGPGLTPSGDDLLVGALAFSAWGERAGVLAEGGALRAALRDAAVPRTTRFAAQMIGAAARGHVFSPLARLLGGLLRRETAGPPDIAPLLAVGETSGGDMLTGMVLGGRALLSPGTMANAPAPGAADPAAAA